MQTLIQSLDFLAAHPEHQLIVNWIVLYEALLPHAGEEPPPFTLRWALRWHLWFVICEDNPMLLGLSGCSVVQRGARLPLRRADALDSAQTTGSIRSLSSDPAKALATLDARLNGLLELRYVLSQAIAETRSLRRTVTHQRKFRSQELVIARYAAIYQYIQLSQPDYPVARFVMDERLRPIACGCVEGSCEHVEYLSKRLSPLSNRPPGRPTLEAPLPAIARNPPLAKRNWNRQ